MRYMALSAQGEANAQSEISRYGQTRRHEALARGDEIEKELWRSRFTFPCKWGLLARED
jgi:hypothetical protein